MKKLFLITTLSFFISNLNAQFASVDFHFINDGMEEQYLELEKIFLEFHKQNIADGKLSGWSLFKVESTNSDDDANSPDYMTLNRFESMEALKNVYEGVTYDGFVKMVKKRMKGKMSTKEIKKILEAKTKKTFHSYVIELKDQTVPPVEMELGETLNVYAMVQNVEDYEKFESFFAKPILQSSVDSGDLKWWGFTKVLERNEEALTEITHFTWDIPVEGKKIGWFSDKSKSMFGGEFIFDKLANLIGESRTVLGNGKLRLVMTAD